MSLQNIGGWEQAFHPNFPIGSQDFLPDDSPSVAPIDYFHDSIPFAPIQKSSLFYCYNLNGNPVITESSKNAIGQRIWMLSQAWAMCQHYISPIPRSATTLSMKSFLTVLVISTVLGLQGAYLNTNVFKSMETSGQFCRDIALAGQLRLLLMEMLEVLPSNTFKAGHC
eukprot:Gb_30644 [translate_table: standard]